jgi:hypothetical protein
VGNACGDAFGNIWKSGPMRVGWGGFAANRFTALEELSIPIGTFLPSAEGFWCIDKEPRFFWFCHLDLRVEGKIEIQASCSCLCGSDNDEVW